MWSEPSPYIEADDDNAPVEAGNPRALSLEISALF